MKMLFLQMSINYNQVSFVISLWAVPATIQACQIWRPNRVRLDPNGTNLGLFKISFNLTQCGCQIWHTCQSPCTCVRQLYMLFFRFIEFPCNTNDRQARTKRSFIFTSFLYTSIFSSFLIFFPSLLLQISRLIFSA